ncbi:TPA: ribosome biogenesis/translation initiation ATPase RLI [Candidatus Micrarchaeota archaeon]|nr:MAG: ribosome biogenesis/translation initiation ATPase RLI [Candidatus Micrarchaeota archaeon CG1_02_51_15]HII38374.1 ribosome biogenesis/translation initiation ATPase RLI [Candidatus Micrarchaeota archaeon]
MRVAVIGREKCTREVCGYQCFKVCPGVKMHEEVIVISEDGFPVIDEVLCSGCGLCVKKCPVSCIKVINLPGESGAPTFQYGPNSFRLYGFPLPKEKAVVGIIGVNGIGKTTALQLLSGSLRPNFGHFKRGASLDELKKEFRGNEVQAYVEALESGGMKVAHKPQYLDKLASLKTTAGKALKECDERGVATQLAELLELNAFSERSLGELSGGELQRLAIACTMARSAQVYFFDEPSSYLDVRQRMVVARAIRLLAENTAVVVVEHDLALLDYLSDFVQVLFGSKGAYGVVSRLKASRNGVNEFLSGYLKDENMRFRDYGIRFERGAPRKFNAKPKYTYSALKRHFGESGFSLEAEAGGFSDSEVVGILGPNAIGKSTFVKLLAGVEQADEGSGFEQKLSVAYKPQYPSSDFEGTVRQMLESQKGFDRETFDAEVRSRLEIAELLDKEVRHLSGGELQRLSIAVTLCNKAGVRLFDEPSAFLDVEQRLHAADLIRRIADKTEVPCFVVDHDLVFIDRVSDRVVLFEGTPSKQGKALAPAGLRQAMNSFLKGMDLTFRRDAETGRPRANKKGSQLDEEQRQKGEYYYAGGE